MQRYSEGKSKSLFVINVSLLTNLQCALCSLQGPGKTLPHSWLSAGASTGRAPSRPPEAKRRQASLTQSSGAANPAQPCPPTSPPSCQAWSLLALEGPPALRSGCFTFPCCLQTPASPPADDKAQPLWTSCAQALPPPGSFAATLSPVWMFPRPLCPGLSPDVLRLPPSSRFKPPAQQQLHLCHGL